MPTQRSAAGAGPLRRRFPASRAEFSAFNFEAANTEKLFRCHFADADAPNGWRWRGSWTAKPCRLAYQCSQASHRSICSMRAGVISVAERRPSCGRHGRWPNRHAGEAWLAKARRHAPAAAHAPRLPALRGSRRLPAPHVARRTAGAWALCALVSPTKLLQAAADWPGARLRPHGVVEAGIVRRAAWRWSNSTAPAPAGRPAPDERSLPGRAARQPIAASRPPRSAGLAAGSGASSAAPGKRPSSGSPIERKARRRRRRPAGDPSAPGRSPPALAEVDTVWPQPFRWWPLPHVLPCSNGATGEASSPFDPAATARPPLGNHGRRPPLPAPGAVRGENSRRLSRAACAARGRSFRGAAAGASSRFEAATPEPRSSWTRLAGRGDRAGPEWPVVLGPATTPFMDGAIPRCCVTMRCARSIRYFRCPPEGPRRSIFGDRQHPRPPTAVRRSFAGNERVLRAVSDASSSGIPTRRRRRRACH